jgi:NADH:ubiquinone oxidoreductase subunit 4 (subunit M)
MRFDANELGMQFITFDNISYVLLLLGLDGLTLPFILLIGLIFPLCYLSN